MTTLRQARLDNVDAAIEQTDNGYRIRIINTDLGEGMSEGELEHHAESLEQARDYCGQWGWTYAVITTEQR